MISLAQCMGADSSHLVSLQQDNQSFQLHPKAVLAWQIFCTEAVKAGFQPKIASAHRSLARQLLIWNEKAMGRRPVLDDDENPINISSLTEHELSFAILRWSALPGLSRHHWGSEIDIYDASAMSSGYKLQLTVEETKGGGVFADFYTWLDAKLEIKQNYCGFSRPYISAGNGIAKEPWHLSLLEVASQCEALIDKDKAYEFIAAQDLKLKEIVLHNFDEIFERFVCP
jgi:LAS superfamily LD-carboxypeptidase LdcB